MWPHEPNAHDTSSVKLSSAKIECKVHKIQCLAEQLGVLIQKNKDPFNIAVAFSKVLIPF